MKQSHRVPDAALTANMTGKLDPAYEEEVRRSTERGEREYAAAQKRLEAAAARADRLERALQSARKERDRRLTRKQLAIAWSLVEFRREELQNLASQMTAAPSSAAHRGSSSYRPVPVRHGGNL